MQLSLCTQNCFEVPSSFVSDLGHFVQVVVTYPWNIQPLADSDSHCRRPRSSHQSFFIQGHNPKFTHPDDTHGLIRLNFRMLMRDVKCP